MEKNIGNAIIYIIVGFIAGAAIDLSRGGIDWTWTKIFLVLSIILIWGSSKFLSEQKIHGYTPDKKFRGVLDPGFKIIMGGFLPWAVVSYATKTFTFNDTFTMVKKSSKANRLFDFRMPTKSTIILEVVNQENFYKKTGLTKFDGEKVTLDKYDWMNHVIKDIRTSFTQLGWKMGYKNLLEDADWSFSRIVQMISSFGLNDSLSVTLSLYGLKLVSVNLEVDLTDKMNDTVEDISISEKEDLAKEQRARTLAKTTIIQAEADRDSKHLKDMQLSEDINHVKNLLMNGPNGIKDPDFAADLAAAALDVFDQEFFLKSSGGNGAIEDAINKIIAAAIADKKKTA